MRRQETRFVGRPVLAEAIQHTGAPFPDLFVPALRRHLPRGGVEITTAAGPRPCRLSDWIVATPDGAFSVLSEASFEMLFAPRPAPPPSIPFAAYLNTDPVPAALPEPPPVVAVVRAPVVRRPYRKD